MKPLFTQAKADPKRVIYADGEDERVLRAAQVVLEEGMAFPILIGRPAVVEARIKRFGLAIQPGRDFALVNPEDDPRYRDYVTSYLEIAGRRGVTPDAAKSLVRTNSTVIAALAVARGEADAMITGLEGRFMSRLRHIRDIIGTAPGVRDLSTMTLIVTNKGAYFLTDTHVKADPTAEELADATLLAAEHVARFGMQPKVALLSHSDFGASDTASSLKMRKATALINERAPDLECDGEMEADTAFSALIRERVLPSSRLKGEANLMVFPNLDAANIAYQFAKMLSDALPVGPILLGAARPAHILTGSATSRGVVNMTAIAVAEAQAQDRYDPA
jgi:malate dehydrogenase (oxaloacetate-decarboxylating)(NADP+)